MKKISCLTPFITSCKTEKRGVISRLLSILPYVIWAMFCLTVFILFIYFYREFSTPHTQTASKIFVFQRENINVKNVKPVKANELLGGDYDRLCMVGGLSTATEFEKILGRKPGYIEYLFFKFYANTGGEASYGTQILYEKNNRIVKHEASSAPIFKPGYDYDKPERNLRFGCMKYNRLYFTLTRNTGNWLHDNNIIYFEK